MSGEAGQLSSPVPLLASLMYADRDAFADHIVGRLSREAGFTPAAGKVLRAFLRHNGWHSNRVWACRLRLASMARLSVKTVDRSINWLKRLFVLRVIEDQDELLAGPGPHDYEGERRGDGPVDCYDLSGLVTLLPPMVRQMLAAMLDGALDTLPLRPKPVPPPRDVDQLYPPPFGDEPQEAPVASPAAPEAPPPDFETSHGGDPSPLCNVGDQQAGETRKKVLEPTPRPSAFNKTKMSGISKRFARGENEGGEAPPAGADKQAGDGRQMAGFKALRRRKVDPPGALKLLREKGDRFCVELALYADWMERQTGDRYGPGWITSTAQKWVGWPDAFERHLARERAVAARVLSEQQQGGNQQAREQFAAAPEPPTSVVPGREFRDLPASEQAEWEERARALLPDAMRRNKGLVIARAVALYREKKEGT